MKTTTSAINARRWRSENPDRAKETEWLRRYGVTRADYERVLLDQDGRCAICHDDECLTLHIDHCHSTDLFRGLVCSNCNHGLGYFQDSPHILGQAIAYLNANKAPTADQILESLTNASQSPNN